MTKTKLLIRLDDACPTMDSKKWQRIEDMLDYYGVKPMVGVIPANADPKQQIDPENPEFWQMVGKWERKGWAIALHGYDHCYISSDRGINPLWPRSEFAGVSLELQKEKIRKGVEIFKSHGINPKYFFAPSHTFDENTLIALKDCSDIRIISDTIATKPYKKCDFVFIPQIGGACRKMIISGIWTFCLHPSTMTETSFIKTEEFLKENSSRFENFKEIDLYKIGKKSIIDNLMSCLYFGLRKLKRL